MINAFWPVLMGGIATTIWMIRLEARINENKHNINRLERWSVKMEERHISLDNKIVNQLSEIKQSLARLEGKLGVDGK